MLLAGGLTPANVAEAIATAAPWGVDVNSGVRGADGFKDPALLERFIAMAKGWGGGRPPMNIVLLQPHELGDDAMAVLRDQRAVHIRGVLKAAVGDSLRVGALGGDAARG